MPYSLAMRLLQVGLLTLAFLLPNISLANQRDLSFSAETDSIPNPAQLPTDALALLTRDKQDFPDGAPEHFRCSDHEDPPLESKPKEQILCTALHFSPSGTDYLVIGVGALRGAHIVPFWVIHEGTTGPALLFKTRADGLRILAKTHVGHRDLIATFVFGAGATIRDEGYRFDGKSYKLFSAQETHN